MDGQSVSADIALTLLSERVAAPTVGFRGYVLSDDLQGADQGPTVLAAVQTLATPPQYAIRVVVSDDEAAKRMASRRQDPTTGDVIFECDVVPDTLDEPKQEGDAVNDEDDVDGDNGDAFDADDGDDDDEEKDPVETSPVMLETHPVPLLPRATYDNAVALAGESLASPSDSDTSNVYFATFLEPYRLRIADTGGPIHAMSQQVLRALELRAVPNVVEPLKLEDPEEDEFDSDAAVLDVLRTSGLPEEDDDEPPPWRVSHFGAKCPVSLVEEGMVRRGKFGVVYCGCVYAMADPDAQAKFLESPTCYADARTRVQLRVLAVGVGDAVAAELQAFGRERPVAVPFANLHFDDTAPDETATPTVDTSSLPPAWIVTDAPLDKAASLARALEQSARLTMIVLPSETAAAVDTKVRDDVVGAARSMPSVVCVTVDPSEDAPNMSVQVRDQLDALFIATPTDEAHEFDDEDATADANFGATREYCPVSLKNDRMLRPGSAELASQYLNRWYHLATEDARAEFISNPSHFLGKQLIDTEGCDLVRLEIF